jgi:hypothetical protein
MPVSAQSLVQPFHHPTGASAAVMQMGYCQVSLSDMVGDLPDDGETVDAAECMCLADITPQHLEPHLAPQLHPELQALLEEPQLELGAWQLLDAPLEIKSEEELREERFQANLEMFTLQFP